MYQSDQEHYAALRELMAGDGFKNAVLNLHFRGIPLTAQSNVGFHQLAADQAEWSQQTFGPDRQKGPLGPLRHLEKEAREAQNDPSDAFEYADCLLLVLDAARRAGFDSTVLLDCANQKLQLNKKRDYGQAPVYRADEPFRVAQGYPPWRVWIKTDDPGEQVLGCGYTPDEALADGWRNVRRRFEQPVEHVRLPSV